MVSSIFYSVTRWIYLCDDPEHYSGNGLNIMLTRGKEIN